MIVLKQQATELHVLKDVYRRIILDEVQVPRATLHLLVAYEVDAEGERGGERLGQLSSRMRRIWPPAGKDITAFWPAGRRCATGCGSN